MIPGARRDAALLFLGDLLAFGVSLWLTLLVRYGQFPSDALLTQHVVPFSFLFAAWLLVFYMSGLYGKRIILKKSSLPNALLKTQVANIVLAALFFFLIPVFGITPKTNLVIYLIVSLGLIFLWRLLLAPRFAENRTRYRVALVESMSEDALELMHEVNGNPRYHLAIPRTLLVEELADADPDALASSLEADGIRIIIVDTGDARLAPALPLVAELSARGITVAELADVYESVFDRIPLTLLTPEWFAQHTAANDSLPYASVKRAIDLVGGVAMGLVTLMIAPMVWLANRVEAPGPLFIAQERFGKAGKVITVYKFRSMTHADAGMWPGEGENRITRVGAFLRKTSLDEFPQFINVLAGEESLIGPRNDLIALGTRLAEALPDYMARYRVVPGITGWAQINQQYEQGHISPQSVEETATRLAYDFYYLKNRSLGLDIVIALKTVKRMFFRVSSW